MTWSHAVVESEHEIQNPTSANKILLLGGWLGIGPDSHVLDVASGHGGPALALGREFGCRVITCVERAPEFLAAARESAGEAGHDRRVDAWLAANPGHPQAEESRARCAADRGRYLRRERDVVGWAILVYRA